MNFLKTLGLSIIYLLQDVFIHFFEQIILILKTILIAIIGGFTDYMLQKRSSGEDFSFRKALFHCSVAGFSGYLAQSLCTGFEINPGLTGFLIGISGFAGTRMISFFEKLAQTIFEKIAQLQIEVRFGKKENEDDKRDDTKQN